MTSSTEGLALLAPSLLYERQILAFREACLAADGHQYGVGGLDDLSVPEWLALLERKSAPETCPEGLVPDSTFLCVRAADNAVVGMVSIRHTLNNYLENYGGHVGYSVHPGERGKGYGKAQFALALAECKALGLNPVLLTCEPWNAASRAVILSRGGLYEDSRTREDGKTFERYWVPIS